MNILNNPTEIAGCILWLDGADKTSMRQNYNDVGANVNDGNQVGYWGDKSGNLPSTNFTNWQTTKRPTYVESVSSLRFASVFSTSLSALGNFSNLNPTTIFVVTAPHSLPTEGRLLATASAGNGDTTGVNAYIPFYQNLTVVSTYHTSGAVSSVNFTALSSYHILCNRNTQATSGVLNFSNGNPSAASSYTTQVTRTCFKIGSGIANGTTGSDFAGVNSFYSGYIAEIIIYNSSLDSVNYTRVNNYLNNKWNPVQYIPKQIFALKSGNWSDTGLWSTSAYSAPFNQPLLGDVVLTNSFILTADVSTTVNTITNNSLIPNVNGGGGFIMNSGVSLSATAAHIGVNPLITCTGETSSSLTGPLCAFTDTYAVSGVGSSQFTLNGSINANTVIGTRLGINWLSTGNLTVNGNINNNSRCNYMIRKANQGNVFIYGDINYYGGGNAAGDQTVGNIDNGNIWVYGNVLNKFTEGYQGAGIANYSTGNIFVIGDVSGGKSGSDLCVGIENYFTGSIMVTGNVYAGTGLGQGNHGISQTGSGRVEVTGTVYGLFGNQLYLKYGISSSTNGRVQIRGDVIGGNRAGAVSSTGTNAVSVIGNIIHSAQGVQAVFAPRCQNFSASTPTYTRHAVNGYDKFVYYYTGDTVFVPPLSTNVLQGVTYNFGALTGAMIVPAITAVNAGVKVGTEIGSAYLSVSDFWNEPLSAIQINSNTIGEYMKKTLTVNSLSSVLNSLDFSKL